MDIQTEERFADLGRRLLRQLPTDDEAMQSYYQEYHEAAAAPHLGDHYGTRYTVCSHPQCREASREFAS